MSRIKAAVFGATPMPGYVPDVTLVLPLDEVGG